VKQTYGLNRDIGYTTAENVIGWTEI